MDDQEFLEYLKQNGYSREQCDRCATKPICDNWPDKLKLRGKGKTSCEEFHEMATD